ncbi:hypothetical protein BH23ACT10_BH23ACT10_08040 [soil metagenome]
MADQTAGRSTTAPAPAPPPPSRGGARSCVAPSWDARGAAPRSAPQPPQPSDADTTTAATTHRSIRPTRPGVAAQPLVHRLPRHLIPAGLIGHRDAIVDHFFDRCQSLFHKPQLHQHDPASLAETDVDDATAKNGVADETGVSDTYRNHCRPATGPASRNCHPPTGATVSSMYRDSTRLDVANVASWLRSQPPKLQPPGFSEPLTCGFAVELRGNRTPDLFHAMHTPDRPTRPAASVGSHAVCLWLRRVRCRWVGMGW